MKFQLMPSAVFALTYPACLPEGDVCFPIGTLLLQFLLMNVIFLWHGPPAMVKMMSNPRRKP